VELFISTGEISGDVHGARVLEELRRLSPSLKAYGIGGARLVEAGLEKTADIEELSLVGIAEVLPRLRSIFRLYTDTKKLLARRRPAAVLLIDSPDFNLRLARFARSLGIATIYYIGPTVWAWRKGRIRTIRDSVDLMLTVFPFEEELYRRHGVRSRFVGHPLVETVRAARDGSPSAAFFAAVSAPPNPDFVALLPGSRFNEVRLLLPALVGAAQIMTARIPSLHFLVPAASQAIYDDVRAFIGNSLPNCTVVRGEASACLAASRAAMVTSGTATLEAALLGTPLVTVYRLSTFSYIMGKLLVSSPFISLPNILAGEKVVEELIQGDCRPEKIAAETLRLLEDARAAEEMKRRFATLAASLGAESAALRTAELVAAEIGIHNASVPFTSGEEE
jgi:lipid-A-disaccharide synthase